MVKVVQVVKVYFIARGNPQQASRVNPSSACPTASPSSSFHHHRSRPYITHRLHQHIEVKMVRNYGNYQKHCSSNKEFCKTSTKPNLGKRNTNWTDFFQIFFIVHPKTSVEVVCQFHCNLFRGFFLR